MESNETIEREEKMSIIHYSLLLGFGGGTTGRRDGNGKPRGSGLGLVGRGGCGGRGGCCG